MEERRRSTRVTAREAVAAVLPLSITVQVVDISVSGVLLQSTRPVESGASGSIRLSLGGNPFSADVCVHRVVRLRGGGGNGYRLGASFVSMDVEHRRVIEQFVSQ